MPYISIDKKRPIFVTGKGWRMWAILYLSNTHTNRPSNNRPRPFKAAQVGNDLAFRILIPYKERHAKTRGVYVSTRAIIVFCSFSGYWGT